MRCLVVGGAGFLGRWVVGALLDVGCSVGAFDDLSSGARSNLDAASAHPGYLGLQVGSTTDPAAIAAVFRDPWDVVVHLGMSASIQRSIDDPRTTLHRDVVGTAEVLEACRRLAVLPHVILISSSLVYASHDGPIAETHTLLPASPFAASRVAIESLGVAFRLAYGMPVTIVRPFNTYGPYQAGPDSGVVAAFLRRDILGEPITLKGSGEQRRDLLYAEDFADLVVRAATREGASNQTFNAGTGADVSMRSLAERCASQGTEVVLVPHDHPQAEVARQCADIGRAVEVLGWRPRVQLEDGIARTRDWLRADAQRRGGA